MLWNDLREYLDKLDHLGMLERVKGAHWDVEIGVITELMVERGGPALLFDEIPDYPRGFGGCRKSLYKTGAGRRLLWASIMSVLLWRWPKSGTA